MALAVAAALEAAEELGDVDELRVTQHEGIVLYGDLPPDAVLRVAEAVDRVVAFPRASVQPTPTERVSPSSSPADGQAPLVEGDPLPPPAP